MRGEARPKEGLAAHAMSCRMQPFTSAVLYGLDCPAVVCTRTSYSLKKIGRHIWLRSICYRVGVCAVRCPIPSTLVVRSTQSFFALAVRLLIAKPVSLAFPLLPRFCVCISLTCFSRSIARSHLCGLIGHRASETACGGRRDKCYRVVYICTHTRRKRKSPNICRVLSVTCCLLISWPFPEPPATFQVPTWPPALVKYLASTPAVLRIHAALAC